MKYFLKNKITIGRVSISAAELASLIGSMMKSHLSTASLFMILFATTGSVTTMPCIDIPHFHLDTSNWLTVEHQHTPWQKKQCASGSGCLSSQQAYTCDEPWSAVRLNVASYLQKPNTKTKQDAEASGWYSAAESYPHWVDLSKSLVCGLITRARREDLNERFRKKGEEVKAWKLHGRLGSGYEILAKLLCHVG